MRDLKKNKQKIKHMFRVSSSKVGSHVFRRRHDVGGRLVVGRLVAGLAVEAAGEAAETVDVGPSGVVGNPPGLGVEGVLLVDVVILSVPVGPREQEGDGRRKREEGGGRREGSARVNTLQQSVAGRA